MRRLLTLSVAVFVLVGCDAYGNPLQSTSDESTAAPADASTRQTLTATVEVVPEPAGGVAAVAADCDVATIDLSGYPAGSHFIFGLGQQPPFGGTFDESRTAQYTVSRSDLNGSGAYGWTLRVNSDATMTAQSPTC